MVDPYWAQSLVVDLLLIVGVGAAAARAARDAETNAVEVFILGVWFWEFMSWRKMIYTVDKFWDLKSMRSSTRLDLVNERTGLGKRNPEVW